MCDFTDIDECQKSPCKNGGTCTNKPGGYRCVCAAGFEGDNCDGGLENTHVTSMGLLCLSFITAMFFVYPLSLLCSVFILYRSLFCVYSLSLLCSVFILYHCYILCLFFITAMFCVYSLSLLCSVFILYHCYVLCLFFITAMFFVYSLSLLCSVFILYHCYVLCLFFITAIFCVYPLSLLYYCLACFRCRRVQEQPLSARGNLCERARRP